MNIAEILKNFPKGTKLYSPICGECQLILINNKMYPIYVQSKNGQNYCFTEEGKYISMKTGGECLLFPSKDNRDWNTMKSEFKKGDFVYREMTSGNVWVSIHYGINPNNKIGDVESLADMCLYNCFAHNDEVQIFYSDKTPLCFKRDIKEERLATEEEKQLLLKALDNEGYMWDEEKLEVREKQKEHCFTPFEKVLVRNSDELQWMINLFSHLDDGEYPYVCMISVWKQCIPYEGNQELLGTCNEPNHKQYEN